MDRHRTALVLASIAATVNIICSLIAAPAQQHSHLVLPFAMGLTNTGNGRLRSLMREPMPWEDGYFDPSYHAWPKSSSGNRQQSASDKQTLRALVGMGTLTGGGKAATAGSTNSRTNATSEPRSDSSA